MKPRFATVHAAVLGVLSGLACCVCPAPASASTVHATRAWRERLIAPAQFDLSLAEISFPARSRAAGSARLGAKRAGSLRLATHGATGLDYVAGAVVRLRVHGRPRALMLVVNRRPRGSLAADLASIELTLSAPSRLGRPLLWQVSNPLTRPTGLTPALCDLPIGARPLAAGDLRAMLSRGPALAGFSAAAALAQAYDLVCRRPYDQAFAKAVSQATAPSCAPGVAGGPCCPPNAICLPPPCPPCPPCGAVPCAAAGEAGRAAVIPCPLASPPIACPL